MNTPTLLDVPPEVARCPFCGGTLQAEVSAPTRVGGVVKVVVYCKDVEDVAFERLEHHIRRDEPGQRELTEAAVRAWVQAQHGVLSAPE